MRMEQYIPSDILKPFVEAFLIIESENGMESRTLPDTCIVMAFRYSGKVDSAGVGKLPPSLITGLRKSPRLFSYSQGAANLLVKFKAGGAAPFFKGVLHELFEASVALDNLIPQQKIRDMEERLAEAKNNASRFAMVEQFLISMLREPPPDKLIVHAVQQIRSLNGAVRIKDLVATLPISLDPFEKRFRQLIGTSPKQFSGIVRLRTLIDHHSEEQSLTRAAYSAGYFDQSHFIKDFKSFTGKTPHEFFKGNEYW